MVIETGTRLGSRPPHGVLMWRWLSFDPPMRDPSSRGCRTRHVSCVACHCALGSTDDPMEAFLIAWRHRRALRSSPRIGATPG